MRGPLERASLGASIDLEHQGRGRIHEAIDGALDFAANVLKLRFLEAGHASQKLRSAAPPCVGSA